MSYSQGQLDAVLRSDFPSFLSKAASELGLDLKSNWHHEAIALRLEQVREGASRRLVIAMPPRHLKSVTVSVAWVAWMLGKNPRLKFICVSYAHDLATKHARDCRTIMKSAWYRRLFPGTRLGLEREADFETTAGGGRLSTSVGGVLTGRGGNYIIIDDPLKSDEAHSEVARRGAKEWFSGTLLSRLDNQEEGAIVLVMQRLHEDDLAGHLIETGDWDQLVLAAFAEEDEVIDLMGGRVHQRKAGDVLHPEHVSAGTLEVMRSAMGSATFSAQYQQRPMPMQGNLVRREWLVPYDRRPDAEPGDQIVQSWDTATKTGVFNDYSVCVTALMRKRDLFILDVYRRKLTFPELLPRVKSAAREWNASMLLIEDAASGQQLLQLLRHEDPEGVPRPLPRKPSSDKLTRLSGQSSFIEQGRLHLPAEAPWLTDFVSELLSFPNGRHDDQVDALSQLLEWFQTRTKGPDWSGAVGGKLFDQYGEVYGGSVADWP